MSYGKIGLTTVAVTHDLLSGTQLVLVKKKNSTAFVDGMRMSLAARNVTYFEDKQD